MIQSRNGQSQSVSEQSKPRSRFTGERLKLLRPDTYRQAVELSAEPREQVPYDHICRLLRVSEHTLKAIEARESLSIAERNKGSWTRRYVSRVKPQIASKIKSTTPISRRPLSLLEWLRKRRCCSQAKLVQACHCRSICTRVWLSYCTSVTRS
jgi:hypothetical protein